MKPKMTLEETRFGDHLTNYGMIERAACILNNHGLKQEAKDIHQRASVEGYDFLICLRLLKEYMEI